MKHTIDLCNISKKKLYPLGKQFAGRATDGTQIGFTNYYMTLNGKPNFGISGEIHFSRVAEDQFEDTIVKAKMNGINIISTYVFWIVHEETEGVFRFDGNRNLRKFLELCQKHHIYVIVRIGPFDHGEMRNGGLPDWLYGMPFECRSTNPVFLQYVRRLYAAIHQQMIGLYFEQGGPIIGIQLDNEYMHSSAPWEMTTGTSDEWVPGGHDGEAYMLALKKIAQEEGIIAPFYTCTAWGGAITPTDEMLPLWGGYAYWPWIYYQQNHQGEHPATPEYIYRDNHNDAKPKTYNFEPRYSPESRPYACCEMMGGMSCSYDYRFTLPFESVDALANIKLGSGCNLLGYYMFRGGSNGRGEKTPFLNENQVPKISYDYQAAIGEFGQIRPSYHRLRLLHYFCESQGERFCETTSVVPEFMEHLEPTDNIQLRYCVRIAEQAGFLFINNFQDHAEMKDKADETICLTLNDGEVNFEHLSIAAGENAILPFNMPVGSQILRHATAQPITTLNVEGEQYAFFFAPAGMKPVYHFDKAGISSTEGCTAHVTDTEVVCEPSSEATTAFALQTQNGILHIVTLTREDALHFYKMSVNGREVAFLTDGILLQKDQKVSIETDKAKVTVCAFPREALFGCDDSLCVESSTPVANSIFRGYTFRLKDEYAQPIPLVCQQVGPCRYSVSISDKAFIRCKQLLMCVSYIGDVGNAFIAGNMIHDNYCNGQPWYIRIDPYKKQLEENPVTLYVTPIREGLKVNVDSPMAARMEQVSGAMGSVEKAELIPVQEINLKIH